MNPMFIMQLKSEIEKFNQRHPKLPMFFSDAITRLKTGDVLEVSLTSSDGNRIRTNIRVTDEDKELLQNLLSGMGGKQ